MSLIRIEDIAHVRFNAPDLRSMATFLQEFGLALVPSADGVLYARGAGPAPFIHATALGEPGFAALGLRAACEADLDTLARHEGVAVQVLDAPGGGAVVRLADPDGNLVEVVAGQAFAAPLPIEPEQARNTAQCKARMRQPLRIAPGASTVVRLGHAVMGVKDFRASEAWYKSRFGLITSDEIELAPGMAIGAFMRCDRGATPTDHHTLFLLQSPDAPNFMHVAFEVASLDDLMRGHAHLKAARRKAAWGVGRHILGSQVFDYWLDPWGHELEHWTDGDVFTAADGSHIATLQDLLGVQWGAEHPLTLAAQETSV